MTNPSAPILITFSDEPLVKDAPRQSVLDVGPFLESLVEKNMAYAGEWVGALLVAEENPYGFLGETDVGDLVEWAKTTGGASNVEFYGLAMKIAGLNAGLPGASERYNLLPMAMDSKALRNFALESLSAQAIAQVNAMVSWAPLAPPAPERERQSA